MRPWHYNNIFFYYYYRLLALLSKNTYLPQEISILDYKYFQTPRHRQFLARGNETFSPTHTATLDDAREPSTKQRTLSHVRVAIRTRPGVIIIIVLPRPPHFEEFPIGHLCGHTRVHHPPTQ